MSEFFFGPGIVLLALFLVAGYTIYIFIKSSHLERMAKIERGVSVNSSSNRSRFLDLKIGMLMIGISLGLFLANFIEKVFNVQELVFYPSFMLLFGGISLISSFFLARKLKQKK